MDELKEQIKFVVMARQKSQEMVDKRKALYDEFQAKHSEFFGDVVVVATVVSEAEAKLREPTLRVYAETGNKAPMTGVGVREVTTYSYDGVVALKWAMEHELALKLDEPEFKAIAKAKMKTTPLPFVTSKTEPQATISPNLEVKEEK